MKCVETIIEVLNENTIIMIALKGEDFMTSAGNAAMMVENNLEKFVQLNMIGSLLNLCGTIIACGLPTLIGFFAMKGAYPDSHDHEIGIGLVVILLFSLIISSFFVEMFGIVMNSMFLLCCIAGDNTHLASIKTKLNLNAVRTADDLAGGMLSQAVDNVIPGGGNILNQMKSIKDLNDPSKMAQNLVGGVLSQKNLQDPTGLVKNVLGDAQ